MIGCHQAKLILSMGQSAMKLLDAWKNARFEQPPYVLDADVPGIRSSRRAKDLESSVRVATKSKRILTIAPRSPFTSVCCLNRSMGTS